MAILVVRWFPTLPGFTPFPPGLGGYKTQRNQLANYLAVHAARSLASLPFLGKNECHLKPATVLLGSSKAVNGGMTYVSSEKNTAFAVVSQCHR
jgi:hypothetical protein